MKTIKEAAEALLSRKEITQEEYDLIEKTGGFEIEKNAFYSRTTIKNAPKYTSKIRSFITGPLKDALLTTALLGGSAVAGKELIFEPIKKNRDIKRSFASMSEKVPQLAEKDPDQIQDYFSVVKTFSPKVASNPLVAGALVNKMIEFGGIDHKLVQDISAIESGLARPSLTGGMVESAAKSIVGVPGGGDK